MYCSVRNCHKEVSTLPDNDMALCNDHLSELNEKLKLYKTPEYIAKCKEESRLKIEAEYDDSKKQ